MHIKDRERGSYLAWGKRKELVTKSKEFCEGISVCFGPIVSLVLRKAAKSVFWSEMNVYVRTWSELCGWQLVGKFSVYWWGGRKFSPQECNETVFSLWEFTLCFFLCFEIDQVKEWTTRCTKSSTYCNSIVHPYLNWKPCWSQDILIAFDFNDVLAKLVASESDCGPCSPIPGASCFV